MTNDEEYMQLALDEAVKGAGRVAPNPLVGAVIVKDGSVVARGYHHRYGDLHAERDALSRCTQDVAGATMYVTLEPCCHTGKQPPCVEAIVEAGIARVVVGSADPNPQVAGRGNAYLREHGLQVDVDVLRDACDRINRAFFYNIQTGRPYVVMKYAMTIDGKIACHTGKSKWVTGEQARAHVHKRRNDLTAIMVGSGTVLADDPLLTCRIEGGVNPVRIVCDTHLRTPLHSQIVQTAKDVRTIIACSRIEESACDAYREAGCEIVLVGERDGHIDLGELMALLGDAGIDSILLEGGATLNAAAVGAGIVHEVNAYVAPKIFGGVQAKSPVAGKGFDSPDEALQLDDVQTEQLGRDLLISGKVAR